MTTPLLSQHVNHAPSPAPSLIAAPVDYATLALRPARLRLGRRDLELVETEGTALERPCASCGGAAFVPMLLEEQCPGCRNDGCADVERRLVCGVEAMEECQTCDATGLELTELGRRVLAGSGPELSTFLRRQRGRALR